MPGWVPTKLEKKEEVNRGKEKVQKKSQYANLQAQNRLLQRPTFFKNRRSEKGKSESSP